MHGSPPVAIWDTDLSASMLGLSHCASPPRPSFASPSRHCHSLNPPIVIFRGWALVPTLPRHEKLRLRSRRQLQPAPRCKWEGGKGASSSLEERSSGCVVLVRPMRESGFPSTLSLGTQTPWWTGQPNLPRHRHGWMDFMPGGGGNSGTARLCFPASYGDAG